jgi:hypothetical protein
MKEGITSAADAVDERISRVSCSNGARSVFKFKTGSQMPFKMAAAVLEPAHRACNAVFLSMKSSSTHCAVRLSMLVELISLVQM